MQYSKLQLRVSSAYLTNPAVTLLFVTPMQEELQNISQQGAELQGSFVLLNLFLHSPTSPPC